MPKAINLAEKLAAFSEHWSPNTGNEATAATKVAI
jgi:hypothetical protein